MTIDQYDDECIHGISPIGFCASCKDREKKKFKLVLQEEEDEERR